MTIYDMFLSWFGESPLVNYDSTILLTIGVLGLGFLVLQFILDFFRFLFYTISGRR